jgi:hypothetical protein
MVVPTDIRYLDVATTATVRPGLYERTLKSFKPLLDQYPHWRLILNVDPVGAKGRTVQEVVDVAKKYFKTVLVRKPATSCFQNAWKFCVSALENDYVFWLEDDWELTKPVDFTRMLELMDSEQDLATMRLPRWPSTDTFRQWNRRVIDGWNGRYMDLPFKNIRGCGYSNNPSLTRREFLQPMLPHITGTVDPEKQIAGFNPYLLQWTLSWRFGVFQGQNEPHVVEDTGEQWRKRHKLGKGSDKLHFRTWSHHKYG